MYVDNGVGKSCDPFDCKSIAQALSWFADHPKESIQMGEKAGS